MALAIHARTRRSDRSHDGSWPLLSRPRAEHYGQHGLHRSWRQAKVGKSWNACTDHIVLPHERHDICCKRGVRQQHQEPCQGIPDEEWQGHENARPVSLFEHELDEVPIPVDLGPPSS